MIYKEKLKFLREKNNLTQKELGDFIGIDRKAYNHFETEYTIIPIKHLNSICNYFNCSIDYILNFNDTINYPKVQNNIEINLSATRLKELRKENNITQDKLADILNVNRTTISKYEKGINMIATPFLYTICKEYNISADYLLGKIDNPKYLNSTKK